MNELLISGGMLLTFFLVLAFFKVFQGLYIGYLITSGRFRSHDLDNFTLYKTSVEEYREVLHKVDLFVAKIIENVDCFLSISSDDMNCFTYRGTIPVKPYQLINPPGLIFYFFKENRLFKQEMSYAGPAGICSRIREIILIKMAPEMIKNIEPDFLRSWIFVSEAFADSRKIINKNEVQMIEEQSKILVGAFPYRSPIIRNLFNSDLNFTEEEIVKSLRKITSVEIIDSQLVFSYYPVSEMLQ